MNATERLDAIEARANAATEGPWDASHDRPTATRPVWAYDVRDSGGDEVMVNGFHSDTVFIAHARQDLPALVAAIRAVLALHQPNPTFAYAADCGHDPDSPGYDDSHRESEDGDPICLLTPQGADCSTCGETPGDWFEPVAHPCPTVRAIDAALDGAS